MKNLSIIILGLVLSLAPMRAAHSGTALEHPRNARLKALMQQYRSGQTVMVPARSVRTTPIECPKIQRRCHRRRDVGFVPTTVPGKMYAIVEREATKVGISPIVVYAIQVHESGNYRSRLWRYANNPGGIEARSFPGIDSWRHNDGRWAAFRTPEDGIRAHIMVLSNHRYRRVRDTSDPLKQVEYIGAAGYCEPGYSWTSKVKAYVRRFASIFSSKPKSVSTAQVM